MSLCGPHGLRQVDGRAIDFRKARCDLHVRPDQALDDDALARLQALADDDAYGPATT